MGKNAFEVHSRLLRMGFLALAVWSGHAAAHEPKDLLLSGKYVGAMRIARPTTLSGIVDGDVTVLSGAQLYMSGIVNGQLHVNNNARALVTGTVNSTITNDGGYVEIAGIYGAVKTFSRGDTRLTHAAVQRSAGSLSNSASLAGTETSGETPKDAFRVADQDADVDQIATMPGGKKVHLRKDGTYHIEDDDLDVMRYSDISIADLKIDLKALNGKRVRTRGRAVYFADELLLTDPNIDFDVNGITASIDKLSGEDRKWIITNCSEVCSLVVEAVVDAGSFLPQLRVRSIDHK